MKLINKSFLSAAILSVVISSAYLSPVVYADEAETTEITVVSTEPSKNESSASENGNVSETPPVTTVTSVVEKYLDKDKPNEDNRFYQDDRYDTKGNATLIKKEQIIYNSEEMQFIAVTTKDGSVFYVLINYAAVENEDNVYFLNKVDDYDLYALLYADQNKDTAPDEAAELASDKVQQVQSESSKKPAETEITEPDIPSSPASAVNTNMILIIGIFVLIIAAVIFILFKFVFGKKSLKKSSEVIDYDEDDDDFDFKGEDDV